MKVHRSNGVCGNLMLARFLPLTTVALLSGCVLRSDVVPAGDGTYLVTGRTGDFGPDVQSELLKKANDFCAARGLAVHVVSQSDNYNPLQVFGPRTGRLYFSCVK
jgi:hypothetical protein